MRNYLKFAATGIVLMGTIGSAGATGLSINAAPFFPQGQEHFSYVPASANANNGALDFVNSMAQRGIGFLSNQSLNQEQRASEFRKLLQDSFDMKTIGRFSLGLYWRQATDAQKAEYQKLFEQMIVRIYSKRFNDYNGHKLEVRGVRPEGDKDAIVTSFIIPQDGGEKIQVDWRVRNKDGQYKVVDIIVQGVSMALTQRADFASVIQRGGGQVEVLLAHLRQQ